MRLGAECFLDESVRRRHFAIGIGFCIFISLKNPCTIPAALKFLRLNGSRLKSDGRWRSVLLKWPTTKQTVSSDHVPQEIQLS